jgi:hypothetical protein
LLFLFGAAIAMLGMAFQAFMRPGQIFNWYALWLIKMVEKSTTKQIVKVKVWDCFDDASWEDEEINAKWYYRLIAKLSKPLGLCPYCNTTWIAIIFYLIYFGISFNIFLLIGIVWFFVKIISLLDDK